MHGIKFNEKGDHVRAFQARLLALEFPLPTYGADGHYGHETVEAARAAAYTFGVRMEGLDAPGDLVAAVLGVQAPRTTPLLIGAWCGEQTLANPERDIDCAARNGIRRLDLVVNDHSSWRKASDFTLRDTSKILRVAELAHAAGIELNLMSWIMPHERYIRGAARELLPLAIEARAARIQWDAEEPWTKAVKPMPYADAAVFIAELFTAEERHAAVRADDLGVRPAAERSKRCIPMSTNAIGHASVEKVGPLLAISDEGIPQCYSTRTSGVTPERADALLERWIRVFSHVMNATVMTAGLACYKQEGIPGHTERSALQTALDEVLAVGVTRVVYWHLNEIRTDGDVSAFIRHVTGAGAVA